MLQISVEPLKQAAQAKLDEYQQEIDDTADYADRVALGKRRFRSTNHRSNSTFDDVKTKPGPTLLKDTTRVYMNTLTARMLEHL